MDDVGFQPINISVDNGSFTPTASEPVPVAPVSGAPVFAAVRDYLSVPRSRKDLSEQLGLDVRTTRAWIGRQLARKTIVRAAYGSYARADRFTAAPVEQLVRPRPVYDALLAYLAEPRRAIEIAGHIGSTVPIATGHMMRLIRQGVVVRIAYGVYVRQDKCLTPPASEAVRRGRPVREKVAVAVDQEKSLEAVAKATGFQERLVRHHLAALVRAGVIERVGPDHYRPVPPDLFG